MDIDGIVVGKLNEYGINFSNNTNYIQVKIS